MGPMISSTKAALSQSILAIRGCVPQLPGTHQVQEFLKTQGDYWLKKCFAPWPWWLERGVASLRYLNEPEPTHLQILRPSQIRGRSGSIVITQIWVQNWRGIPLNALEDIEIDCFMLVQATDSALFLCRGHIFLIDGDPSQVSHGTRNNSCLIKHTQTKMDQSL